MNKNILAFVFLSSLLVAACVPPRPDQQLVASPDPVALRLASAVDRASSALQTLASVEQARNPGIAVQAAPYAPQELRRTVSLTWVGPIVPVVQKMADRAGYQLQVNGDAPPAPIIVNLQVREESVVEVLRDIGLQAGTRADVVVDTKRRIVELDYAPVSGG